METHQRPKITSCPTARTKRRASQPTSTLYFLCLHSHILLVPASVIAPKRKLTGWRVDIRQSPSPSLVRKNAPVFNPKSGRRSRGKNTKPSTYSFVLLLTASSKRLICTQVQSQQPWRLFFLQDPRSPSL